MSLRFSHTVAWLPWCLSGKESACQSRRCRFDPWVEKSPWRRKWQPTPVFLPGKPHGQRNLAGYSPWGRKESDMTYRLNNSNNIWSLMSEIPFFLRLNKIPLCIYHILFVSSSVSGCLGRFHCLAIVINSAINMEVQIPLQDPAYDPEVELLDHIVDLLIESASSSNKRHFKSFSGFESFLFFKIILSLWPKQKNLYCTI